MTDAIATAEDIEIEYEPEQKASWEHEQLAQVDKNVQILQSVLSATPDPS